MDHPAPSPAAAPRQPPPRRALVLGGGGSLGNAWLIGVVAGLAEAGLDVTDADVVIGTSADSTAAAQITGAAPAALLDDIRGAASATSAAAHGARRPGAPGPGPLEATNAIIAESRDPADMRRRIGAWVLAAPASSDPAALTRWHDTVAARLPSTTWPERRVLITAVDADTGEPVVLDRDSGVDLVDAVAASCGGALAYPVGDRRLFDGGYRTNADNADLAAGCERVLVLSPFGGRSRLPESWGLHLSDQVLALRAAGSTVETVHPDTASLAVFGDDMMNVAARPAAAEAGRDQGIAEAERLKRLWT